MTEGQGRTAASAPGDAGAGGAAVPDVTAAAGAPAAPRPAGYRGAHAAQPAEAAADRPAAGAGAPRRVDARRLESALLEVRRQIIDAPLFLDAPGVEDARAERRKLLSQIDDYLLPRLRESGSPVLVALVGSTGAGKSTLVNSLVGKQVSNTGIRRPTTNSPVLASHPSEVDWFAENVFLPTLPRVRQQGLAMPGRDGLLVLASSEGMPKGVALLDTPDIDSVVQAHHEFAHQFLDASDLWLFMTTSTRYADAAVWELLQYARDRGAALGIVLSRVPPAAAAQLIAHFDAMLAANGLGDTERFVIPETVLTEDRLPSEIYGPIREWLQDTAAREDRRVAVLTQTMSGVLDTFRARIPVLAGQVEAQLALRAELRSSVDETYAAGLAEIDQATGDGSLLRGEILARWQDFAGTGDLLRTLQARRGSGPGGRPRRRRMPARASALKASVSTGLESLVGAVADRSAEAAVARWRRHPAGGPLLTALSDRAVGRDYTSEFDAEVVLTFGEAAALDDIDGGPSRPDRDDLVAIGREGVAALAKSAPDLARRAARAISAWQDHVMHLVEAENVTKRSIARVVSFDVEPLALVLTIGLLGAAGGPAAPADTATAADAAATGTAAAGAAAAGAGHPAADDGPGVVPQHLLTSLFGAGPLRDIAARARADLHERIALLFDEEMRRFSQVIDWAGVPDDASPGQLRRVAAELETAR